MILSACGCEDYDDLLRVDVSTDNDDDGDNDNEDEDDETFENSRKNKKKKNSMDDNKNENPVLKLDVMLKKLHADPGTFSALTDSVKSFLVSLPNSSERTILGCYVADRYEKDGGKGEREGREGEKKGGREGVREGGRDNVHSVIHACTHTHMLICVIVH